MKRTKNNERGLSMVLGLLVLSAIMVIGYVLISRVLESDTGEKLEENKNDTIDKAIDSVDKVEDAQEKANNLINRAP